MLHYLVFLRDIPVKYVCAYLFLSCNKLCNLVYPSYSLSPVPEHDNIQVYCLKQVLRDIDWGIGKPLDCFCCCLCMDCCINAVPCVHCLKQHLCLCLPSHLSEDNPVRAHS